MRGIEKSSPFLPRVPQLVRVVVVVGLLFLSIPIPRGRAQDAPVRPPILGTYRSFSVISPIPESWTEAPETMVALGRLWARGPDGQWMLRVDAIAGMVAGRYFLDGLMAGPQVTLAHVATGDYMALPASSFAEFYPVIGGGAFTYWRWRSDWGARPRGVTLVPAVLAGAGVRVYERGLRNPGFFTVDVAFEYRFGIEGSRILIRLSSHRARP